MPDISGNFVSVFWLPEEGVRSFSPSPPFSFRFGKVFDRI